MLSVILLVFTIVIMLIGGFCGFRRGMVKQGVRMALWGVLFAGSCFFIPQLADSIPLKVAELFKITATDVEQVIAELLKKAEILRRDTYLIVPLAAFVRSLLVPFLAIIFYWATGVVSELLFLIIGAIFFRNKEKKPATGSKVAGLLLGIMLALFGGMLTLYPLAEISAAIKEGDAAGTFAKKAELTETVANSFEASPVQMVYRFTGTEWLAGKMHGGMIDKVISVENQNIWKELPGLVHLGAAGLNAYSGITEEGTLETTLEQQLSETMEAYFSLNFISEENKLLLLKRLKATIGTKADNEVVTQLLDWIAMESKEQLIADVVVYGALYDILKEEGIMGGLTDGTNSLILTEEAGDALLNKLYLLSNAETVIPGFLNWLYDSLLKDDTMELIDVEHLEWNEQTKADISEVVSVICRVSSLVENMDSLTTEQKRTALNALQELKDNDTVGKENYAELLRYIMSMM